MVYDRQDINSQDHNHHQAFQTPIEAVVHLWEIICQQEIGCHQMHRSISDHRLVNISS